MKNLAAFVLITLSLTACFNTERIDSVALNKEIKSRKIKRVNKTDLIISAEKMAEEIIASNHPDSLNKIEGINIAIFNEKNIANGTALETQFFEAYTESLRSGVNPGVNVQFLENTAEYLITKATHIDSTLTMYAVTLSEKKVVLK